jgi:hypothetical protein
MPAVADTGVLRVFSWLMTARPPVAEAMGLPLSQEFCCFARTR